MTDQEKALENINKECENFKKIIKFEVDKLNRDNFGLFVKKLINNYSKVEDSYFTLLNESKSKDARTIFLLIQTGTDDLSMICAPLSNAA